MKKFKKIYVRRSSHGKLPVVQNDSQEFILKTSEVPLIKRSPRNENRFIKLIKFNGDSPPRSPPILKAELTLFEPIENESKMAA